MDGSTLKRSLRAAEMCDLVKHRSMRLQVEVKICQKRVLGQAPNCKYLLFLSWVYQQRVGGSAPAHRGCRRWSPSWYG